MTGPKVSPDVAARAEAEEELVRLRAAVEEANRLKDEFLSTMSHELRTPLNSILGWAHLLRTGTLDEAATARALEIIERSARAQDQIIADMLDVSRMVAGTLRLDVQEVDPVAVVEAALATARATAEAKGIGLETALDPSAGTISGDPARLQQVVWTLLSNGMKFTPRRGRVLVRLTRAASHVTIAVEDTGGGIDPQFLPQVFERFGQAVSSSNRGLGLGLAVARHLVELHGGTVRASSSGAGKGSTFTVELPVRAVTAERAAREPDPAALPSLHGVRVLIVDDEPEARELVSAVLRNRGADVVAAGSAADGLAALGRRVPDVLISDIEMPGEDGYALIRKVRALPAEGGGRTPAVALTAYARAADRVQASQAGFERHLSKPVEPAELVATVARLAARDQAE